jgi:hypothetical protein
MKPIKVIFSLLAGWALIASCTNDLNPKPLGQYAVTGTQVYSTPATYLQGLAKIYGSFNLAGSYGPGGNPDISAALTGGDTGAGVYSRQYWNFQTLSTDEAVIAWTNNADLLNIHYQNWEPNGGYIAAMYTRIMFTVTLCNEFIRQSAASTDTEVKQYHAEARFLRALAYWHALDLYGNPPFVTETDPIGSVPPKQIKDKDLYAYIVSELTAIEGDLGAPRFNYGHADKGALWMLQAKVYMNAGMYGAGAGDYTAASGDYTNALVALNKIFAAGYTLAPSYRQNFCADNDASPEIIFPITQDVLVSQTYGGMTYFVHAAIVGSMQAANFGVAGGWGGTRTTSALYTKFADPSGATDQRAMFYTPGQTEQIDAVTVATQGYGVTKFTNLTFAGVAPPAGSPDFCSGDVVVFRLADANLMYAECVLRNGTGGDINTAVQKVNDNLTRAYGGSTSGNITAPALTLDWLLDERARELYWEGHRRTDLIRFAKFSDNAGYVWPWKGNVAAGATVPSTYNRLPLPSSDLNSNPNLKQNNGYN